MEDKKNMSIKEYLLSQGINTKSDNFKRSIKINEEDFNISIIEPLKYNLDSIDLSAKEIFALTYKSLNIIKNQESFNIAYTPKDIVLKGKTKTTLDSLFEIHIFDSHPFNSAKFEKSCNVSIIDSLDKVFIDTNL